MNQTWLLMCAFSCLTFSVSRAAATMLSQTAPCQSCNAVFNMLAPEMSCATSICPTGCELEIQSSGGVQYSWKCTCDEGAQYCELLVQRHLDGSLVISCIPPTCAPVSGCTNKSCAIISNATHASCACE